MTIQQTKIANKTGCTILAAVAAAWLGAGPAEAQSAADFYRNKDLRLIVTSGAGGGYDVYSRLLARHIGDHIPGRPHIVVENMPGASGLRGTNWLYNVAPKDGTVIGGIFNNLVTEPLLGNEAAKFDPTKFEWIGAMGTQYTTCAVWHTSPIKTIDDVKTHEVRVSTEGLSGNSALVPQMLNKLLGTKFTVISGYTTDGMRLALEQGEVEGICGFSYDTFNAAAPEWLRDKKIRFILQTGGHPAKQLPDVPLLLDSVRDPTQRAALKVLEVGEEIGRPHLFPPGVPAYLVTALRTAFDETMKDPKLLADAARAHLDLQPTGGDGVAAAVKEAYAAPKDVVAEARRLWPPAVTK